MKMMMTIDTTPTFYAPTKADAVAAEMNASDPDWTYTAVHNPKGTGYSFITIHDEDGEFVAKM